MPKFGDLSYATPRPQYVGQPVEEMKALGQAADQKHQQNQELIDKLDIFAANANVGDHPEDIAAKQEAIQDLRNTFKSSIDSGRLELAGSIVKKGTKDLLSNQRFNAALTVPAQRAAIEKAISDAENNTNKDLRISKETADKARKMNRENYQGTQKNPITGQWEAKYPNFTPAPYVDAMEVGLDTAKGWIANKWGEEVTSIRMSDGRDKDLEAGDYIVTTKSGRTITKADQKEIKEWVGMRLQEHQGLKDYDRTLNTLYSHENRNRNLEIEPTTGYPIDYINRKDYYNYKEDMLAQAKQAGKDAPSEKDIANSFDNDFRRRSTIARASGLGAAKYGYTEDVSNYSKDISADPYKLQAAGKEGKDIPTIDNESVLVPGENFDSDALSTSLKETTDAIATIQADIDGNKGNYNVNTTKLKAAKRMQSIQSNSLNNVMNNYFESTEGKKDIGIAYNKFKENHNFKGTLEDFKKVISTGSSSSSFMERLSGYFDPIATPQGQIIKQIRDNASEYVKKDGISFSAKVLTGGKAVENINKVVTSQVTDNKTNYLVEGGIQLDQYLDKILPEGGNIKVAVMNGKIGNQYGYYMTINDKEGKTVKQIPIYPKSTATTLNDHIGLMLMKENVNKEDAHKAYMYNQGEMMRAETFNSDIDNQLIEAETSSIDGADPVGSKISIKSPVVINVGDKQFKVIITKSRIAENAGDGKTGVNTVWEVNKVLQDGTIDPTPVMIKKSLDDIKLSLFRGK